MFLHWHLTSYEVLNDVHTSIWTLANFQLLSPLFTNINFYLCANHLHVYLHLITTYHLPISLINMTNPLHDMLIITYYPTYPPTKFTHKIYPPQNLLESESGVSWALYITIADLLLSLELKLLETILRWHPLLPSLPLCNRSFHHYCWVTERVPPDGGAIDSFLDHSFGELLDPQLLMKMIRSMISVRKDSTFHPFSHPARNERNPSPADDRKNRCLCQNPFPCRVAWESRSMLETPMMINQSITQH